MTSRKFLNDKTDYKDFLRSFLKVVPYALIALAVLSLQHVVPVVQYVTSPEFRMTRNTNKVISYFCDDGFLYPDLVLYGMVMCGIIMGIMLFRFVLNKKSVNVFFSMGITRTRLYINRILAGSLALLLAVFIPMTAVLIINLVYFGSSSFVFEAYFYEVCVLFVSGLAGFSITVAVTEFSGSLIEAVLCALAATTLPQLIASFVNGAKLYLLPGYTGMSSGLSSRLFSPLAFAIDLDASKTGDSYMYSPYIKMAELTSKPVEEAKLLDTGLMLPVIIWVAVSIVLLALGLMLINKRKAENSNSFGRFYISSALLGTHVFAVVLSLLTMIFGELHASPNLGSGKNLFYNNTFLCLFVPFVILLIAFFVAELIIRRKLKGVIRMWPVFAVLTVLSLFTVLFISSGLFGSYNKLPKKSEIQAVAIEIDDPLDNFTNDILLGKPFLSTDVKDIELAMEQFEKIRDARKVDDTTGITIAFKFILNDKEEYVRQFTIYDSQLYEDYLRAVFASNYMKSYRKFVMLDPIVRPETDDGYEYVYNDGFNEVRYAGDFYSGYSGELRDGIWYLAGADGICDGLLTEWNSEPLESTPFEDTEELFKAICKDYEKLSYDDVYMNSKRPVAVLFRNYSAVPYFDSEYVVTDEFGVLSLYADYMSNYNGDASYYRQSVAGTAASAKVIYVYENMTETLEYLKSNGYNLNTHEANIKEVYYTDSKLSCRDAMRNLRIELSKTDSGYYYWEGYAMDGNPATSVFCAGTELEDLIFSDYFSYIYNVSTDKKIKFSELLNYVYDNNGHPLIKADSPEKAQAIADRAVPFYCNYRDEGRYVYIVYDDQTVISGYLPQASLNVIG